MHRGAPYLSRASAGPAVPGPQLRSLPEPPIPEAQEEPSFRGAVRGGSAGLSGSGGAGAGASAPPALPGLPEGVVFAPDASPTVTGGGSTTHGSGARGKARPRLPAWWARRPDRERAGGDVPPSPETSLSPAQLKNLARDLAARLAAERRPGAEEAAPAPPGEIDLEMGVLGPRESQGEPG